MNLSDLSGCNLIGLASSLSILLGENLSANELNILSAFLSSLGDNLALIAAAKSIEEEKNEADET